MRTNMVLEDRHIEYLQLVRRDTICVQWTSGWGSSSYISTENIVVNQLVAAQMMALGATHIVTHGHSQKLALTSRGESILVDEEEAWA